MIIKINDFQINISLYQTDAALEINKISELKSQINTWGEEIYFKIPIKGIKLDKNARDTVHFGELAYWVEGNCIAIGFGPTPASLNKEIRLVTKVNIVGSFEISQILLKNLKSVKDGDEAIIIN